MNQNFNAVMNTDSGSLALDSVDSFEVTVNKLEKVFSMDESLFKSGKVTVNFIELNFFQFKTIMNFLVNLPLQTEAEYIEETE